VSARRAFRTARGRPPRTGPRKNGHLRTRVAQRDQRVRHGEVLHIRHDDVPLPRARGFRRARTARLFRLGGARGEDRSHPAFAPMSAATSALARRPPAAPSAPFVDVGGRVPVPFEEVWAHRRTRGGREGCRNCDRKMPSYRIGPRSRSRRDVELLHPFLDEFKVVSLRGGQERGTSTSRRGWWLGGAFRISTKFSSLQTQPHSQRLFHRPVAIAPPFAILSFF